MGLYTSSAPAPDPAIGEAAVASADLGKKYLNWMKKQSAISNEWADEDRSRYKSVFEPLQDQFITEAQEYDTPERRASVSQQAVADVAGQIDLAEQARERELARMGVDPTSGKGMASSQTADIKAGLAKAGAANTARRQVEAEGRALRAQAVNLGSGFAVNPATSLGMAGNSMSSGFQGAMQGYNQQGNLLNTQYQQQLQAWNANQASSGSLMSGLGSLAGMAFFASSKDYKTNKRPVRGVLDALKEMPVESWDYKDGIADGGSHIGPYAEDFQKATGKGDGKTIPVVDAVGVTMGAVQELSDKVDDLAGKIERGAKGRAKSGKASRPRGIKGVAA